MPARSDLDPAEIKPILPNLVLAEVKSDPFRVKYRIVGTEIARVSKVDFTNRHLDELFSGAGEAAEYWKRQYLSCCEKREPVFGVAELRLDGAWTQDFEWAILPLSTNGVDVDMAIAIEDYDCRT